MNDNYTRYSDEFTKKRRLAFVRSRCQAQFRGEEWHLTFEEYCHFFDTEKKFYSRGKRPWDLVFTRLDPTLPWDKNNCCIISRLNQLRAQAADRAGYSSEPYFKEAEFYGR